MESCFHSDNCAAYPDIGGLKAIGLLFVPPYTTSVLQPMDQGAICSLKAKYRNKVVQKMIEAIHSKKSLPTISLLGAMKMLVIAWDKVTDRTMQNCFKKVDFSGIGNDDVVSDYSFATMKDSIPQLGILEPLKIQLLKMLRLLMICLCQQKTTVNLRFLKF